MADSDFDSLHRMNSLGIVLVGAFDHDLSECYLCFQLFLVIFLHSSSSKQTGDLFVLARGYINNCMCLVNCRFHRAIIFRFDFHFLLIIGII